MIWKWYQARIRECPGAHSESRCAMGQMARSPDRVRPGQTPRCGASPDVYPDRGNTEVAFSLINQHQRASIRVKEIENALSCSACLSLSSTRYRYHRPSRGGSNTRRHMQDPSTVAQPRLRAALEKLPWSKCGVQPGRGGKMDRGASRREQGRA
jgi:hypothetical protein